MLIPVKVSGIDVHGEWGHALGRVRAGARKRRRSMLVKM